jgi:hypothetical protein
MSASWSSCGIRRGHGSFRIGVIVMTIVVVFAYPASADCMPGYKVSQGGVQLILSVDKTGDSVIAVSADDRQRVHLTVEGASSKIEYSTEGHVSSRRIEADFGTLGRIDVRLKIFRYGAGVVRRRHCTGPGPIEGLGTYRGRIAFARLGGVPEVSVESGRVYFERRFRQVCKRRSPQPKPDDKRTREAEQGFLAITGKSEGRTALFSALIFTLSRNPTQSWSVVGAETHERREGVRITRSTSGFVGRGSFVISEPGIKPETVQVELPPPFAGRAVYSHSPSSPAIWTGDLRVDLPGADGIPLTGPGFGAVFCRGMVDSCR